MVDGAGGWSYAYDCNGNMTARNAGSGADTLAYNADNKLATAKVGSATTTYTYDGDGIWQLPRHRTHQETETHVAVPSI